MPPFLRSLFFVGSETRRSTSRDFIKLPLLSTIAHLMASSWQWYAKNMTQQKSYFNSTLGLYVSPNATYGLQEALGTGAYGDSDIYVPDPFGGYTTISILNYPNDTGEQAPTEFVFFDTGCSQSDCITACAEPNFTTIFPLDGHGLQILHNCNLLPNVAIWETQGDNSKDGITAIESVFSLDTNHTSTAIQYINTLLGKSIMSQSY